MTTEIGKDKGQKTCYIMPLTHVRHKPCSTLQS